MSDPLRLRPLGEHAALLRDRLAGLTGAEQADLLRGLAAAESQHLAARSAVLAAFDRGGGYAGDAAVAAGSWLRWQARGAGRRAGVAVVGAAPDRLDRSAP